MGVHRVREESGWGGYKHPTSNGVFNSKPRFICRAPITNEHSGEHLRGTHIHGGNLLVLGIWKNRKCLRNEKKWEIKENPQRLILDALQNRSLCLHLNLWAKMHSSTLWPGENRSVCPLIHDHCRLLPLWKNFSFSWPTKWIEIDVPLIVF